MGSGGWDNSHRHLIANERKEMNKERAKEVAAKFIDVLDGTIKLADYLASLPEFQEKKNEWFHRVNPKPDVTVLMWNSLTQCISLVNGPIPDHCYWRYIPPPPEPEDSELAKDVGDLIRSFQRCPKNVMQDLARQVSAVIRRKEERDKKV